MITVTEAEQVIHQHHWKSSPETVDLTNSLYRYLAEKIIADRDLPPFDRVTMDGIAINWQDFKNGQRRFPIASTQYAGEPPHTCERGKCVEIMTGAVCPVGADTIIRYEDLEITTGKSPVAEVGTEILQQGINLHRQGSDHQKGALLIEKGQLITPAEIAVMASVGKKTVSVNSTPRVAIISTGNELVDTEQNPEPHQIRKSNSYTIQAILQSYFLNGKIYHLPDHPGEMETTIGNLLREFDVLIFTGGVSRGKSDFVPGVLNSCGVTNLFHRVQQKPGKPFWFGVYNDQKLIFALPGNPVSTVIGIYRYFLPWLEASFTGRSSQPKQVILSQHFLFKPNLTYFLQVKIAYQTDGTMVATPVPGHGSGDFANLLQADGFCELKAEQTEFKAGTLVPFYSFRKLF